jgi:MerR family redox-sensitive transcriptional activator SoxR
VAITRVAQGFGVLLGERADLIRPIPPGKRPTAAEIRAMVAGWRAMLRARIDGLTLLRDRLDGCIGCGCLFQTECPLRNPSDTLGPDGQGPVLLQRPSSRSPVGEGTSKYR